MNPSKTGELEEANGNVKRARREIKTFQDITTGQENTPSDKSGMTLLPSLSKTNWLPPVMAPQIGRNSIKAVHGSRLSSMSKHDASLSDPALTLPSPSSNPPIDWSLKKQVRIISRYPIHLWNDCNKLSRKEVIQAEKVFAQGLDWSHLSLPQKLLASTMTWIHPSPQTGFQPSMSNAQSLSVKKKEWQSAFCSIYDSFRNGHCGAFYVVPQSFSQAEGKGRGTNKLSWSAVFTARHIAGRKCISAVLSRSSPGLRATLREYGIDFCMPLAQRHQQNARIIPPGGKNDSAESTLLFEGTFLVHGFFDFLLNKCGIGSWNDNSNVPAIVAPVQFLGATLCRFPCNYESGKQAFGTSINDPGSSKEMKNVNAFHMLTLRDIGSGCPAWIVDRMLGTLASADSSDSLDLNPRPKFQVYCEPLLDSVGLGVVKTDDQSSETVHLSNSTKENNESNNTDAEARQLGCIDVQELHRWKETSLPLAHAALKELLCRKLTVNNNARTELENISEKEHDGNDIQFVVLKTTRVAISPKDTPML